MKYTIIGPGFLGNHLHSNIPGSILVGKNQLSDIIHYDHDIVVVAAPTGNRIRVMQDAETDWKNCQAIIDAVSKYQYKQLVYISTVDTYSSHTSDSSLPDPEQPQASYGRNRWALERSLKQLPNSHVMRLPSLSDLSIQKNILYDLKNLQWLNLINLDSKIQWYVLDNLLQDVQNLADSDIDFINLTSAPILNYDIVKKFTPGLLAQLKANQSTPVTYDVQVSPGIYHVPIDHVWRSFEKIFIDNSIK